MLARKNKNKSELFALHTSNNCIGSLPTSEQTQYHDDTYFTEFVALFACARVSVCCFKFFFQSAVFFYPNADSMCLSMRMECFNYSTHRHTSTYDAMCWSKSKPSQTSPNDSQLYICKFTIGKSAIVFIPFVLLSELRESCERNKIE